MFPRLRAVHIRVPCREPEERFQVRGVVPREEGTDAKDFGVPLGSEAV